ncbi:hypothetical protein EMN47_16520 [Prolixibacteraceae bacterium JC049]|nr:hypothetical protein [Prolixibacteraceae bacterium JC049]
MKKLNLLYLPEIYLIVGAILAGFTPPFSFNPIMLFVALILGAQLMFRNKVTGILLGSIVALISFYFTLAFMSELLKFPAFNKQALQMLLGGGAILIANFVAAGTIIYKYTKDEEPEPAMV